MKIVQRFDLGVGLRKKVRTGQSKKSQSGTISPIWREAPTVLIETKICVVGYLADVIMYANYNAKFQDDIFRGYDFRGVEFPIFLLFLHGPYNSAVLVCSLRDVSAERS